MSSTLIYDRLVEEFKEAGMYYGEEIQKPETVSLSAFDDTQVLPALEPDESPFEKLSARVQELNVPSVIDSIRADETEDTVYIPAIKPDEASGIIRDILVYEADGTPINNTVAVTSTPTEMEEGVGHVFPIRVIKKEPAAPSFDFFSQKVAA